MGTLASLQWIGRRETVEASPQFRLRWLRASQPALPDWLGSEEWVPPGSQAMYAYGRTALRAALDARGHGEGDVALLPAFISSKAVWPFLDLGIDVRFYPTTASLSLPADLGEQIRELQPDIVLFVHYLGFADPEFQAMAAVAREVGATVVEDCARGLFSRDSHGNLLGTTGDIAMYSVRKLLPVPSGGLVVANTEVPQPRTRISERGELVSLVCRPFVNALPSRRHPGPESITEVDRSANGLSCPEGGRYAAPGRLTELGLARSDPAEIVPARRSRYTALRNELDKLPNLTVLTPPAHEGACPYGVAVRVPGRTPVRDRLFHTLRRRGLPAERFRWRIAYGEPSLDNYPEAVLLHDAMLVFPTHQTLPWRVLDATVHTVAEVIDDAADV